MPDEKMPKTVTDALKLWDDSHPVTVFRVETEDADQEQIYATAFEYMRPGAGLKNLHEVAEKYHLTERERSVALSIANSALRFGWAEMIEQHTASGDIPLITVQKPPEEKGVAGD